MSKVLKSLMRDQLGAAFEGVDGGLVITTQGLNSERTYAFRAALHARNLKFHIVKNSLARHAFQQRGYKSADVEQLFTGPVGVVFTTEEGSATIAAKAVNEWKREVKDKVVKITGAFMEGQVLNAKDADALKNAPSKMEARAMLLGIIQAPVTQFLATIREPYARVVYLLNAYKEKREEG